MVKRRSDTRQRIQETALELFAELGYEQTSLREIAERLGVTKAALYYHFTSKEEIVASLIEDVAASIDELVAWAASQEPTAEARAAILRRLAALAQGRWRPLMRFAQENGPALRQLAVGADIRRRYRLLFSLFDRSGADLRTRVRGRLAVSAVMMGSFGATEDIGASEDEVRAAALAVALELVAPDASQVPKTPASEAPRGRLGPRTVDDAPTPKKPS